MKRLSAIASVLMLVGLGLSFSPGVVCAKNNKNKKNKDFGTFSVVCLDEDKNLSNGATVSITPGSMWPPNHKLAKDVLVQMKLNADAPSEVPVSFSITSISSDQVEHDDEGGHGCGKKTSKQGADWAPTGLDESHPLTVSGNLQKSTDLISTEPEEIKLRRERCAQDGSRTYELEVVCCDNTDSQSPECDSDPKVMEVLVPHDRGHQGGSPMEQQTED